MARINQAIYENSRGQQIILDGESVPWREIMGRTGCGVPSLRYSETAYANGVTETTAISMQPRDVGLFFWMDGFDEQQRKTRFHNLKLALLEIGKKNEWGRLLLRCSDGQWLYLDCIYSGGLNGETEIDARFQNFTLEFHSSDPLFYEDKQRETNLTPTTDSGLKMPFRFGKGVRFLGVRIAVYQHNIKMNAFMAWPEIEFVGPAKGIRFDNAATGKSIYFREDFELLTGETLMISTRPLYEQAHKKDAAGVVHDVATELSPGATLRWSLVNGDNLISVRMSGAGENTRCMFRYREGHLSTW